jgi:hypothetical protein
MAEIDPVSETLWLLTNNQEIISKVIVQLLMIPCSNLFCTLNKTSEKYPKLQNFMFLYNEILETKKINFQFQPVRRQLSDMWNDTSICIWSQLPSNLSEEQEMA